MGEKGERTRQMICEEARKLFAEKGYKTVTMKDVCERTGLSRGGLYRHYESTEQIFLELMHGFANKQHNEFIGQISRRVPASQILEGVLDRYAAEMADRENSLSGAIYEYYSSPEASAAENSVKIQYEASRAMWTQLLRYGMETGEFREADADAVFNLIVFSYQGVRMYSRLMELDKDLPLRMVIQIKNMLLSKEDSHG